MTSSAPWAPKLSTLAINLLLYPVQFRWGPSSRAPGPATRSGKPNLVAGKSLDIKIHDIESLP
ncbi:hypothetical protein GCM10009745_56700 [Kribbella yunnanensis]|uniref:Uncharacterized protein n=1 Tax=Kribbella yunnanensis TaxID=190194 RepID=A0ABP4UBW8_9ACTN